MDFNEFIVRDRQVCGGVPVVKGTRVLLRTILACLADGDDEAQLLKSFPSLQPEHVRAAIRFAALSAMEDMPWSGAPSLAGSI